jgi:NAD(P)H-dependent flavin oxidoreductase YrpB (nitropropane dioxygenase family)
MEALSMFQTRITEMLGIKYPIVMGGMMFVGTAGLAAAVSNAGGLGIIAAANTPSPGELRAEIKKFKSLSDKPFGVNVSFAPTFQPIDRDALIDVSVEEGAAAIETAQSEAGRSAEHIKKTKVKWIHKVARVRDAIAAEQRFGVDIVAVVGFECGGAPSLNENPTFILIPLVADAVKVPIIAGGGVGDARGFIAALALGAEGVIMGTRFIATHECIAHHNIKEAIIKGQETDTTLVLFSDKAAERVWKNEIAAKVQDMESRGATWEEKRDFISGEKSKRAFLDGDINYGILPMGQVIGLIREEASVKEIIEGIVNGATTIYKRLPFQ